MIFYCGWERRGKDGSVCVGEGIKSASLCLLCLDLW